MRHFDVEAVRDGFDNNGSTSAVAAKIASMVLDDEYLFEQPRSKCIHSKCMWQLRGSEEMGLKISFVIRKETRQFGNFTMRLGVATDRDCFSFMS